MMNNFIVIWSSWLQEFLEVLVLCGDPERKWRGVLKTDTHFQHQSSIMKLPCASLSKCFDSNYMKTNPEKILWKTSETISEYLMSRKIITNISWVLFNKNNIRFPWSSNQFSLHKTSDQFLLTNQACSILHTSPKVTVEKLKLFSRKFRNKIVTLSLKLLIHAG